MICAHAVCRALKLGWVELCSSVAAKLQTDTPNRLSLLCMWCSSWWSLRQNSTLGPVISSGRLSSLSMQHTTARCTHHKVRLCAGPGSRTPPHTCPCPAAVHGIIQAFRHRECPPASHPLHPRPICTCLVTVKCSWLPHATVRLSSKNELGLFALAAGYWRAITRRASLCLVLLGYFFAPAGGC